MKSRYLKVLVLYAYSTLVPTLIFNSKWIKSPSLKYLLRLALGYGYIALGLKILSKLKRQ